MEDLRNKLALLSTKGNLRKLPVNNTLNDFSSNDYLGFARSSELRELIESALAGQPDRLNGATGSRLLSGNSVFIENAEAVLAEIHNAESGLLFNSGYAANLSFFSCVPDRHATVIYDEFIHASVIDGVRLSFARKNCFRHNDLQDLERKLRRCRGACYVAVESVYSMDGEIAPLTEIASLCQIYQARLVVDEAHALGVFGTGLVDQLALQQQVFARIVTFGKALGLHGAVVLGAKVLTDFLINFARPFIFSTAMSCLQVSSILSGYDLLQRNSALQLILQQKCLLLKTHISPQHVIPARHGHSPIYALIVPGNPAVLQLSSLLQSKGYEVKAIRSPSVPAGKERIRICVHTYNSDTEIINLCNLIKQIKYQT